MTRGSALIFGLLLAAGLCTGGSAKAQHMNAADAPCRDAVATSDAYRCFSDAYKQADRKLNDVYGKIVGFLASQNRTDESEGLRKAQRLWVEYRDADCAAAGALYGTGSGGPVTRAACLGAETKHRIDDLKTGYGWLLKKFDQSL